MKPLRKVLKQAIQQWESGKLIESLKLFRYVLKDGQTHVVDSSSLAFGLATKYSFREAYQQAGPQVLEPIMNVEVTVPSEYQVITLYRLSLTKGLNYELTCEKKRHCN